LSFICGVRAVAVVVVSHPPLDTAVVAEVAEGMHIIPLTFQSLAAVVHLSVTQLVLLELPVQPEIPVQMVAQLLLDCLLPLVETVEGLVPRRPPR
jgi:hypothetical protein